jgi:hypothetical protein
MAADAAHGDAKILILNLKRRAGDQLGGHRAAFMAAIVRSLA